MTNFKDDILAVAKGEPIVKICIANDNGHFTDDGSYEFLDWKDVETTLDYEYNDDFGSADCHRIFAWTATKVIFVSEYDGATSVCWVHRDPTPSMPCFF